MKLSGLPKILPGIHPPLAEGTEDAEIAGIAHDSRRVKPGWVFVAIRGHQRDGADFAENALSRGAAAVVSQRKLRLSRPVLQFMVPDARRALAALANSFFGRPSSKLHVVGVTGTNGKTTTTYLLRSIIEAAGHRCGLLGTVCYDTGRRALPASITTPESVDVQGFLAEMVAEGVEYAALEVSSHALCMRRVDLVHFAAAVFTNLSPEHMDYHGSLSAYRQAKARLFRMVGPAAYAIINADDETGSVMEDATFAKVLRYGLRDGADVTARINASDLDGTRMALQCAGGTVDIRLPMIGTHNVYNALAAATAALALGHDMETVREGLQRASTVPGRLETVVCEKGCRVLVDYAHTDHALRAVLRSLREVARKRIIVVFGAGGDRDRTKRPRMGRVVEAGADVAWVTNDNPRSEEPMAIIEEILSGVKNRRRMHVQPDRQTAITEALHAADAGDILLIAGKGHERIQRFRDTVVPFDDRQAVRRALTESSEGQSTGA